MSHLHLREAFFEKVAKSGGDGLGRADLEIYMYEQLGVKDLTESHSILSKITAAKLNAKGTSA